MVTGIPCLGIMAFAGLVKAAPRSWSIEAVDLSTLSLDEVAIPHYKRQIITGPGGYQFDVLEHLAGIAPYFDSPGVHLDPSPPSGCSVKKATYMIRHSNIYANDFDYETYLSPFLTKLANFTDKSTFAQTQKLAFLANYTSPITNETGQVEKVTPSGKDAAKVLGGVFGNLYGDLLNTSSGFFNIWSASATRDTETTEAFISGLPNNNSARTVVVYEGEDASANTLTPHSSCPNFDSSMGSVQSGAWYDKYAAPIIARFNEEVPGFNFTVDDVVGMQQLCGYDTVIRNRTDFCNVFSAEEWMDFEYGNDLMYFYSIGYGNPIAPQLGMPWVRSALDILNSDSATSDSPFNQSLYLSFSHREEPPLVLTALGLFNNSAYYPGLDVNSTMPTDQINYNRAWKTSDILPFLGHVGIERMECTNETAQAEGNANATSPYVRVLVNSAPIPMPGCQDGPGDSCGFDSYTSYIQQRVSLYGDFIGACGINSTVTNATDLLSIYNA